MPEYNQNNDERNSFFASLLHANETIIVGSTADEVGGKA
jgi:hypothetical protein